MTTAYEFTAIFTKLGVPTFPSVDATVRVIDDNNNVLIAPGAATTKLTNQAGAYHYSYSGADNLSCWAMFYTSDATFDRQYLVAWPEKYIAAVTVGASTSALYASLDDCKAYHNIKSTNAVDDSIISLMLESASRTIDNQTGRIWYTHTTTKYFDMPRKHSSLLVFDEDCVSITTLTNGNGVAFASTDFVLYPYEGPPYDSLGLVDNPTMSWSYITNRQKVISALGVFGRNCATDIRDACLMIVVQEYHRRYGEKASNDSIVLPSGMVISPGQMPKLIEMIMANNRKIGMA